MADQRRPEDEERDYWRHRRMQDELRPLRTRQLQERSPKARLAKVEYERQMAEKRAREAAAEPTVTPD